MKAPQIPESYRQARQACVWWLEADETQIVLAGPDAGPYLQTQITQDVLTLPVGQTCRSALVERKGHIQALFRVLRVESDLYWLLPDAPAEQGETLLSHLEAFHFIEKVEISTQALKRLHLEGPETEQVVQSFCGHNLGALKPGSLSSVAIPGGSAWLVPESNFGESGVLILCSEADLPALIELLQKQFQLSELVPEAQEMLRLEAGTPLYGREINRQTLLPETGLEKETVAYDKGCFLGQEVIARIRTYGLVPQALMGLVFEPADSVPAGPGELLLQGKKIGRLSSLGWSPQLQAPVALAYLHKKYREQGLELNFELADQRYSAQVRRLPLYTPPSKQEQAQRLYEEGLTLFAGEDETQAIPLLEAAIQKDPLLADAYESLGVILSRQGLHEEAIDVMKTLTEVAPDEPMAHTNLSRFFMLLGDREQAEEHMAQANRLNMRKELSQTQAEQEEARQRAQKEEMLQMFREVLETEDPKDLVANFGLGKALLDLGRGAEAVPYLETATAVDPYYSAAYLQLGKALEQNQRLDEARQIYQRGIEIATEKGDLMPKKEMETRRATLANQMPAPMGTERP